ncbi:putative phage tail protein [Acetobacterium tundrae]|uniref:DUF2313 domain-containing protein n=1 Tax=Acetobacterium tundrae TaxID=132932 RepID=A0ABR6WND5_9FIRM|nr:putative phage tail protein [Acetobacterium tundrae]MBC3798015.1 DUF2313 domain-containing protein [Acetobacterium tundrae]
MRITSEQTQAILTSKEAQKIIDYISPIYSNGPVALSILNAIGKQLDDLDEWVGQLWTEINPLTATWALKYWEINFGLAVNSSLSLEERRTRLLKKMITRSRMTPYSIEYLAKNICGREIEVEENTAYRKFDVNIYSGDTMVELAAVRRGIIEFKKSQLYFDLFMTIKGSIAIGWSTEYFYYSYPECGAYLCGELP